MPLSVNAHPRALVNANRQTRVEKGQVNISTSMAAHTEAGMHFSRNVITIYFSGLFT